MDNIPNWLLTLIVLGVVALIFAGINIGMLFIGLAGIVILAQVFIIEPLENRKKKQQDKEKAS